MWLTDFVQIFLPLNMSFPSNILDSSLTNQANVQGSHCSGPQHFTYD